MPPLDADCLEITIEEIHPFANFSSISSALDLAYELPQTIITGSSENSGEIRFQFNHRDINENSEWDIISWYNLYNDTTEQIEIERLIGETIYIGTNDDLTAGTPSDSPSVKYTRSRTVPFWNPDQRGLLERSEEEQIRFHNEPRSIAYLNTILTLDYHRHMFGSSGWLQTTLEGYDTESEFVIETKVRGIPIQWRFEKSLKGKKQVQSFLTEFGLDGTPTFTDFSRLPAYIKPLRDVHHTNMPDSTEAILMDTQDRWVVSNDAKEPASVKPSLWKRFKQFIGSEPSIKVEVGGAPAQRANCSDTVSDGLPDPFRVENLDMSDYKTQNDDLAEIQKA